MKVDFNRFLHTFKSLSSNILFVEGRFVEGVGHMAEGTNVLLSSQHR